MPDGSPDSKYGAVEVPYLSYCWHYGVAFNRDGDAADRHYDVADPCPGPHGIMWAAR